MPAPQAMAASSAADPPPGYPGIPCSLCGPTRAHLVLSRRGLPNAKPRIEAAEPYAARAMWAWAPQAWDHALCACLAASGVVLARSAARGATCGCGVQDIRHGVRRTPRLTPWPGRAVARLHASARCQIWLALQQFWHIACLFWHNCALVSSRSPLLTDAERYPHAHTGTAAHAWVHVHTHMCACVSEGIVRSMSS